MSGGVLTYCRPVSEMPAEMPADLLQLAREAKGFMPEDEGLLLHRWARERLPHGPVLEVGTYCGKSAIYLGAAAREVGGTVFTVDHHRGSEENQAGWEHHDASLVDPELGLMDTLPVFRRTIARAGLEDQVVAVVGRRTTVSGLWRTPLSLLFIDGGHAEVHAQNDYAGWAPWLMNGGALVIHGVFPDPADGGAPPYPAFPPAIEGGSLGEGRGATRRTTCSSARSRAAASRRSRRSARCGCYDVRRAAPATCCSEEQPHSRASSPKCGPSEVPRMMPEPAVLCPATSPRASTARITAAAVYVVCSTRQCTSRGSSAGFFPAS